MTDIKFVMNDGEELTPNETVHRLLVTVNKLQHDLIYIQKQVKALTDD